MEAALALGSQPGTWILIALAYLLGAVPFGLVLTRLVKGIDLRTIGSGNIGATNVMRAMGRPWGLFAFALDFLKGLVPVLAAPLFLAEGLAAGAEGPLGWLRVLGGAAAVLGHCFPVYLGFKGGKGVATGCGAIVAIDPVVFLVAGVGWLVTLVATRFVGLSSLVMGALFPLVAWLRGNATATIVGCLALTALIFWRHRSNMGRMMRGEEPKIGRPRPGAKSPSSPTSPNSHV